MPRHKYINIATRIRVICLDHKIDFFTTETITHRLHQDGKCQVYSKSTLYRAIEHLTDIGKVRGFSTNRHLPNLYVYLPVARQTILRERDENGIPF